MGTKLSHYIPKKQIQRQNRLRPILHSAGSPQHAAILASITLNCLQPASWQSIRNVHIQLCSATHTRKQIAALVSDYCSANRVANKYI